MIIAVRTLLASSCVCSLVPLLQADVVATTLQNVNLSLTPSAGSLVFLSSDATVSGTVSNSFGGMAQKTVDGGTGAATVNVSTPGVFVNGVSVGGADVIASANAAKLTSDNLANAQVFDIAGSAAADAKSTLTGSFEIVDVINPVTLQVGASLQVVDNFAETFAFGISGSSEALYSLTLSNGAVPVSFDSLVTVGPNQQSGITNQNFNLTGNAMLQPDTVYSFTGLEESRANVLNSPTVPEPSYLFLSMFLLAGLIAARQRRLLHRR